MLVGSLSQAHGHKVGDQSSEPHLQQVMLGWHLELHMLPPHDADAVGEQLLALRLPGSHLCQGWQVHVVRATKHISIKRFQLLHHICVQSVLCFFLQVRYFTQV